MITTNNLNGNILLQRRNQSPASRKQLINEQRRMDDEESSSSSSSRRQDANIDASTSEDANEKDGKRRRKNKIFSRNFLSSSASASCNCYQNLRDATNDEDDSFVLNLDANNVDANRGDANISVEQKMLPEKKKKKYSKHQKWVLICVSLVSFTTYLLMAILAPFFPNEASLKGMSETLSGLVFSIYALIIMISSPLFGKVIPIIGPKFLLLSGILISGGSNVIFGLLDKTNDSNFFIFSCFLVRSLEGFGAAAFSTASFTYIMHTFPNDVSSAFGLTETFIGIGETIGPAVGGALYTLGGYGLPFYVLGSFVLLTIPLCYFNIEAIDVNNPSSTQGDVSTRVMVHIDDRVEGSYWNLIKIPDMLIISLIVIVGAQNQGFLEPTIEPHFRSFGLGAEYVSLVFLLMAAAYAVTSPLTGWAANKVDNKYPLMISGLVVSTIGLLFLGPADFIPIEPNLLTSTIAMLIMGISYALAFIPTFESMLCVAIINGFEDDITTYSLISGLWSSMFSLGEVIGPSLGGLLVDLYGFPIASSIMAILSLITVMITTTMYIYGPSWAPNTVAIDTTSDSDSGIVNLGRRRRRRSEEIFIRRTETESCPLICNEKKRNLITVSV